MTVLGRPVLSLRPPVTVVDAIQQDMVASIDQEKDTIYSFKPPRLWLSLAIGRKRNAWYLIFAKPYPTADCREVARLDVPGSLMKAHQFWFSEKAVTGWEPQGKSLLEYLLSMSPKQPAVLNIVSNDCWADRPNQVTVLVPEHRLAHWCEGCHVWENMEDPFSRWIIWRPGPCPRYLCPVCYEKDWLGSRAVRTISGVAHAILCS
ncbi:hypothetical protein V5O48_002407 [Marasmius crinis-equi]|uniref:Uncharacterized protein n=1 Tax=Marasmius crinis-equi TaxID=585013 RepID=A0ABR3FVV8_9AGAR